MDGQLVELAGRNWLTNQILLGGLEVARPERDRGIDLIAYTDIDKKLGRFVACPIQMKAATQTVFSLNPKYEKFPSLLLVYVWYLYDSAKTCCYALTYQEAFDLAFRVGWTKTDSWLTGGRNQRPGYSKTRVGRKLQELLSPFQMKPENWWSKITGEHRSSSHTSISTTETVK